MDREEKLRQFLHDRKMKQNGDKFKKWLEKNANNFELVSYQGSHIPVKVKCKTCGFVKSNVTPTQFKKAPLCPVCDDINRTNESFLKRGKETCSFKDVMNCPIFGIIILKGRSNYST